MTLVYHQVVGGNVALLRTKNNGSEINAFTVVGRSEVYLSVRRVSVSEHLKACVVARDLQC